ncbi:MAG: biotin--[acetyl-CoA-carboxylase] ligase [Chloracidobacterium sp.]|nr:biotin--[acetyl-CoA-carboxylase] ligase [Chloracidobacterium sp.]
MNITILRFDMLGSTNDEAANHARRGAVEGLCVIARQQTAGRGRMGRSWASEPDAGLYFSSVLRPKIAREQLGLLTLMAGIAVHDTLSEFGLSPDIKWVNDILVNERKISGILGEAVETPTGLAVILGIGINVKDTSTLDIATSIETELSEPGAVATGFRSQEADSMRLVETALIEKLINWYKTLSDDRAAIIDEWARRSSYFRGKHVCVTISDGIIEGTTDGLEPNGALRVKLADGSVSIVQAGDVERLREKK